MRMYREAVRRFHRNVWLLLASTFCVFTAIGISALAYNLYLVQIGFYEDYIGLFSFSTTLAIALAALPAGWLSQRLGSRRVLLLATVTLGLVSAALALTTHGPLLLALAVLSGAATAAYFVPSAPFLMDQTDEAERPMAFTATFTTLSLASVLGSLLAGQLPTWLASYGPLMALRLTLLVGAAWVLLGAVPLLLATDRAGHLPAGQPVSPDESRRQERAAQRVLAALVASTTLIALATGLVLPFFNVFLAREVGADSGLIGYTFAAGSLAMVICSLAAPAVAGRLGTVSAILWARLATVPLMVGLALWPNLMVAAAVYILRAGLISLTWPLDNSFVMEILPPRRRLTAASLRSTSWNLGWALASLVAGQLIVHLGYRIVFLLSAGLLAGGAIVHFAVFRAFERRAPAPATVAEPSGVE